MEIKKYGHCSCTPIFSQCWLRKPPTPITMAGNPVRWMGEWIDGYVCENYILIVQRPSYIFSFDKVPVLNLKPLLPISTKKKTCWNCSAITPTSAIYTVMFSCRPCRSLAVESHNGLRKKGKSTTKFFLKQFNSGSVSWCQKGGKVLPLLNNNYNHSHKQNTEW